jgi:hypothetical protein
MHGRGTWIRHCSGIEGSKSASQLQALWVHNSEAEVLFEHVEVAVAVQQQSMAFQKPEAGDEATGHGCLCLGASAMIAAE